MQVLKRLYYHLTAWLPRPMPTTKEEFHQMKLLFMEVYDIPNRPDVWYTIASHLQSTKPWWLRKCYFTLINPAKRLDINQMLEGFKRQHSHENQVMLNEKLAEKVVEFEKEQKLLASEGTEVDKSYTTEC